MLSLIAKLALDMGDNNTFRMATASLVCDDQSEMETHYFNAIRAAKDCDWMTAEDEIRRAGDVGLPRNVVDQVLASGLQSRASIWRYVYYSLCAALA
jgi:hypothetical protein